MQLDALIGELLLRNNCVVVPKFGGFIATQLPASIDFTSGRMQAPKKSILFNKQLTNSDGLLISAYAAKNSCSYDEAAGVIDELVKNWFVELHSGKRITFEKVGFLYFDSEKNIRFEQDRFFNLLLQSFGMGQVQFVSEQHIEPEAPKAVEPVLISATAAEKAEETPVITLIPVINKKDTVKTEHVLQPPVDNTAKHEATVIPITKKTSRRRISRYVAAACLLPIAFYSVWIPMKTDVLESGMFSFQDFNPFHEQSEGTYVQQKFGGKLPVIPQMKSLDAIISELPEDVSVFPLEFENEDLGESNDLFYIRIRENEETQPEQHTASESVSVEEKPAISVEKTVVLTQKATRSNGKFKVVAGSFSNENNAASLAGELKAKGFSAFTMEDSNGLHRVIAGASDSNSEANEIVNRLQQNGVASWILK